MLNMLGNVIILEPFIFFYYDYMTMIVLYNIYDLLYDCVVMLNPNPK